MSLKNVHSWLKSDVGTKSEYERDLEYSIKYTSAYLSDRKAERDSKLKADRKAGIKAKYVAEYVAKCKAKHIAKCKADYVAKCKAKHIAKCKADYIAKCKADYIADRKARCKTKFVTDRTARCKADHKALVREALEDYTAPASQVSKWLFSYTEPVEDDVYAQVAFWMAQHPEFRLDQFTVSSDNTVIVYTR